MFLSKGDCLDRSTLCSKFIVAMVVFLLSVVPVHSFADDDPASEGGAEEESSEKGGSTDWSGTTEDGGFRNGARH
jgi:hypothetical protein